MSEFMRVVDPAGAIVTHDSGSPRDQLLPFYRATRPRGYLGLGQVAPARHRSWSRHRRQGRRAGQVLRQLHGRRGVRHDRPGFRNRGRAAAFRHCTIVLNNSTMAIEIPHMKLSHEKHKSRDLGGNYADAGARTRRLERAGRRSRTTSPTPSCVRSAQTEDGHTCLLEFVTSAETAFSHRNGAAA